MWRVARPRGIFLLAFAAAILLALTSTQQAALALAGATYLLKGTQVAGQTMSDQELIDIATPWIIGMTGTALPEPITVVDYPASAWPISVGGFSDPTFDQSVAEGLAALPAPTRVKSGTVIAGGSQGAVVTSLYKRQFNEAWATKPQKAPHIIFGLVANPMRPNGGLWERFASLGTIPIVETTLSGATPTETAGSRAGQITTYDIARQYDGFADFPTNPLFVLSDINAVIGMALVHPDLVSVGPHDAVLQDEYGDTRYYLVPTYPVPILMPLEGLSTVGPILADMLDPEVRLLVEAGYNRTISPGVPTPADYTYFPDPIALLGGLLIAMPTGLDNGLEDILGVRLFGTKRPDVTGQGAYGISRPPVTIDPPTNDQQDATTLSASGLSNTGGPSLATGSTPADFGLVGAPVEAANPAQHGLANATDGPSNAIEGGTVAAANASDQANEALGTARDTATTQRRSAATHLTDGNKVTPGQAPPTNPTKHATDVLQKVQERVAEKTSRADDGLADAGHATQRAVPGSASRRANA